MKNNNPFVLFIAIVFCLFSCTDNADNEGDGTGGGNNGKEKPVDPESIVNNQTLTQGIIFPKGKELETLCVIDGNLLNDDQRILAATLQGLAAKTSSEQIFIEEGGATTTWKNYLASKYGIQLKDFESYDDLIKHFDDILEIGGYILYDRVENPRSLTAAVSLCGPLNAIIVNKNQEAKINALGITKCLMDVSDRNEKWVFEKYPKAFYKKFSAELSEEIHHHLRDYVTLTNCFAFYDGITAWRTSVLKNIDTGGFCIGGGPDEFEMIKDATELGIPTVGSNMASNLAPLSSIYNTTGLQQESSDNEIVSEKDVHYVCFLLSDGDNVAYDLWTMHDIYKDPLRGSFPVGYTISPDLYDLAPPVLRWYYDNKTDNDNFVCGPSGSGYVFPTMYPDDKLDQFLGKCDELAAATGLRIYNVIDYGGIDNMELWNKYLSKPNIDAIMYTGYGEPSNGSIKFADNGKPIIEAGDLLWGGLSEEADLIQRINAKPTDSSKSTGYTLIFVHVWTKGFSNMKTVVDGFNPNIRVVTPENFVKLIKQNINN